MLIKQLAGKLTHIFSFQASAARSFKFSGDCIDRVTPVPIPNTEVKPVGADDTAAFSCGKVGSRRI